MAYLCNSADDSKKSVAIWAKNKKSNFSHFDNYNSGSKHDNYTNDPIFLIYPFRSIHWFTSFLHFKTFKIQSHGSSFALCYCPKNTHLHVKDKTFKPISI